MGDLQATIEPLRRFYHKQGRMPSYEEMKTLYGYSSKNAAYYLAQKLIDAGYLIKDATGRLLPVGKRFGLPRHLEADLPRRVKAGLPVLGYVQAGFPSPAEEELIDTLSLDEYLIENPEMSFMLKVSGDSMQEAGIHPEDIVIVERGRQPKNGDIVLAQVDGEWTLKYYQKRKGQLCLVPGNHKYPIIRPERELRVEGIIRAAIRKY